MGEAQGGGAGARPIGASLASPSHLLYRGRGRTLGAVRAIRHKAAHEYACRSASAPKPQPEKPSDVLRVHLDSCGMIPSRLSPPPISTPMSRPHMPRPAPMTASMPSMGWSSPIRRLPPCASTSNRPSVFTASSPMAVRPRISCRSAPPGASSCEPDGEGSGGAAGAGHRLPRKRRPGERGAAGGCLARAGLPQHDS
jgi:hypothetical protein